MTGVLLRGTLDDGVAGLLAIASRGGRVVVQDPDDAVYRSVPEHALRALTPDHVVAVADVGEVLAKIAAEPAANAGEENDMARELLRWENEIAVTGHVAESSGSVGAQAGFTCPDCQSALSDIDGVRYRCRVGHAWTAEALLAAQGSALRRALRTALRTLEEKVELTTRLAAMARARGSHRIGARQEEQAKETSEAADVLRARLHVHD